MNKRVHEGRRQAGRTLYIDKQQNTLNRRTKIIFKETPTGETDIRYFYLFLPRYVWNYAIIGWFFVAKTIGIFVVFFRVPRSEPKKPAERKQLWDALRPEIFE